MPLDANCPKCRHVFPITEARSTIGVSCPGCETELTAEFRKRPHPNPASIPTNCSSRWAAPWAPPPLGAKKHRLPDDEESEMRGGGGMGIVVFAGVSALVLAVAGLGATGYLLFTNLDTSDSTINNLSSDTASESKSRPKTGIPGGLIIPGQGRPKGVRPGTTTPSVPDKFEPFVPPFEKKLDDSFDLKPVTGTHQVINPPPFDLKNPVTLKLPGPAEAVTVGGNGRYIIFHIPATQQLTVFDAGKGRARRHGETPRHRKDLPRGRAEPRRDLRSAQPHPPVLHAPRAQARSSTSPRPCSTTRTVSPWVRA